MRNRESGLTLVEVCMTLVVFMTLSVAVMSILFTISTSQKHIQGKLRAEAMAEQVIQQIKVDLEYATQVWQNDPEGLAYVNRIGVAQWSPLGNSRLPVSSALGHFAPDAPDLPETGNLLVIARRITGERLEFTTTAGTEYARLDQFRFIAYFITGYLFYAAILVAIGSVCDSLKEAQNLFQPVMFALFVPLATMFPITRDPNGTLAQIITYIPLYTPFAMMNRASGPPPLWEYILSSIVIVVSVWLAFRGAAKVFRVGVLMTGKPPKIREILRWMRAPVK